VWPGALGCWGAKGGRAYQNLNDAKQWRDCAAEMRGLSDEMGDPTAKILMLDLANHYDKLAARAQERANTVPAPSPIRE
jgi:hypothetical protein